MSQPLAHLYGLALRTLDDQERRADGLRSHLGPVLAAAALGVSLLTGGERPTSVAGRFATTVAAGALLVAVTAAFRVLTTRQRATHGLDPRELAAALRRDDLLDDNTTFYATMIVRLGDRASRNALVIDRLANVFTIMVWGILVMLCGLALAAIVG